MIQTETWSVGIQTETWSVDYRVGQKNDNVPTSAERNPARPMFSSPPLAVLSFLSNEELYNASLVSKWWNRLALDDSASASPTKKEDSLPRKVLQLQAPLAVLAFLSNEELYNFIESRAFKAELSESSAPTGAPAPSNTSTDANPAGETASILDATQWMMETNLLSSCPTNLLSKSLLLPIPTQTRCTVASH